MTEGGQPGLLGQDVIGLAAVVIKNSDAIVLILHRRTMASPVMEKTLADGFAIFKDAQVITIICLQRRLCPDTVLLSQNCHKVDKSVIILQYHDCINLVRTT